MNFFFSAEDQGLDQKRGVRKKEKMTHITSDLNTLFLRTVNEVRGGKKLHGLY